MIIRKFSYVIAKRIPLLVHYLFVSSVISSFVNTIIYTILMFIPAPIIEDYFTQIVTLGEREL